MQKLPEGVEMKVRKYATNLVEVPICKNKNILLNDKIWWKRQKYMDFHPQKFLKLNLVLLKIRYLLPNIWNFF